jgi:hypothetical protein
MARRRFLVSVLFSFAVMGLAMSSAFAQGQGNGVVVDADGVLRTRMFPDPTGMLTRQRLAAAQAALVPDMAKPSKLRKVSLNRLEAVAAQQLATGQGLTDDMRYLAGLTRIRNVFFYPDTGDIVIAGTAEGFMTNTAGRPVGIHTGRAVLELQDLVVAMRAFPPSGKRSDALVVSIDPTPEGLAKMRQYLVNISGRVTPADDQRIAMGLKENLGLQNIRIEGIPRTTHFAQVMVEADYRMKLIGIGLESPAVRIPSYVSKANPRSVARNALQRWYFTPNYDCVRVSEDALAMALEGEGVQLLSEDQFVQADGARGVSATVDRASQEFVNTFTAKYAELAAKEPVYAQLRNLIDMAITAAFIQQQDYYGQASWKMEVFGSEERFAVETYPEPKQVETAVNAIWKGNTLMTPVGGGVSIRPMLALASDRVKPDEKGELKGLHEQIQIQALPKDQWWWD